jgi:hypothetical protein
VLIVLKNESSRASRVLLDLRFPPGHEDDFTCEKDKAPSSTLNGPVHVPLEVSVPPGSTARKAFTNITARDGVPCQTYEFTIVMSADGKEVQVPYRVTTIRGSVVNPGKWALYLPAGVALVWSVAFAWVLSRMAEPGAWKMPSKQVEFGEGEIQ